MMFSRSVSPHIPGILLVLGSSCFCVSSATFALFPANNVNQQLLSTPPLNIQRRPFASTSASASTSVSNINHPLVSENHSRLHTRLQASVVPDLGMIANSVSSVSPKVNAVLVSTSVAILAGYHINLFSKEFKSESNSGDCKTWRQYQADTREDWAKYVRDTEGWLYAIQTLRNAITAQTFLATTVLSLLTLITGRIWDILRSASKTSERQLLTVQLTSIAMPMLISAYQFLQGVRLMTHAGFMFPVKKNDTKVDNIMRQTQNCQWLGLRWMYISLAPIAWAVGGSRAFFVSASSLLQFFRSIDKKPEGLGHEEFQGGNI